MKIRYYLLAAFLLVSLSQIALAQFPGMKMGGQNMNMGHFYGKMVDQTSGKSLEGVTIQLIQNKLDTLTKKKRDFILSTILSDKKGEFSFENLPIMAAYRIKITAVGFKSFEKKIAFEMNMSGMKSGDYSSMLNNIDKDLGNIPLEQETTQLQNVTVNSNKPLLQLSGEKKIYNVEKDISAAGGTALDVMKNVPTVNVDIDGNVSMRNAAPQIFVDGRPTTLSLDQIPADQISSIEIISNPSAKFDASGGGAGILNIVLKKNRKTGYNGNARVSIDSRGKPGMGGDFSFRQNKINVSLGGMLGFRKTIVTNTSERTNFLDDTTDLHLNQNNNPIGNGHFSFLRPSIDFLIDNRNTLTINGNIGGGNFKNADNINLNFDSTGKPSHSANRETYTEAYFKNYGTGVSFKHNFAKAGMEWTVDANLNYNENRNVANYSMKYDNNSANAMDNQHSQGNGSTRFYTLQSDFVNPLAKGQKFETGLRASIKNFQNKADNYFRDSSGNYTLIPGFGTNYSFEDMVLAAYSTYSRQMKKWSYQLGLRVESSNYNGSLLSQQQKFENNYPLSLFPSLNLTYKVTDKQDLQFNYSRKINRPNFFQIIPFVDSSDILNISVGNPDLIPEFTQLGEVSYSLQYGNGQSLLASTYGKLTNDLITRYQYKDKSLVQGRDSILISTYGNASRSYSIGLELTGKNKIGKWWEIITNLNMYNAIIEAGNLPGTSASRQFSWFAKINNTFKLPKNYTIQLTGDYQAKTLLPSGGGGRGMGGGGMYFGGGGGFGQNQSTAQGYTRPYYGVDISIKKEFLKNNAASLTLQCNDIFRTRTYSTHAESEFFFQDNEKLRDPQVFKFSFNWRFGKMDASLFKRKNLKGDMENMQNMQNMMAP